MRIRKANCADIRAAADIYDAVVALEGTGRGLTGWVKGVYPTAQTALDAFEKDTLFVAEEDGKVLAAAKIDNEQPPAYDKAAWETDAPEGQIMVLHTLAVAPDAARRGIGTAFVKFYELYARENGCPYLRIDTNAINKPARALYKKLGYKEISIVPCSFNGIENIMLVCMEKTLSGGGE